MASSPAHRALCLSVLLAALLPMPLSALAQNASVPVRLRFDPETEIRIYRSVPHTVPGRPQQLAVPLAVVRGRHSKVVLPHHARQVSRVPKGEYLSLPGGHMFPLERPQDTAHLLRELFGRWQGQSKEHSA